MRRVKTDLFPCVANSADPDSLADFRSRFAHLQMAEFIIFKSCKKYHIGRCYPNMIFYA